MRKWPILFKFGCYKVYSQENWLSIVKRLLWNEKCQSPDYAQKFNPFIHVFKIINKLRQPAFNLNYNA